MKLIIAGKRSLNIDKNFLDKIIGNFNLYPEEYISGGASGVDSSARDYCKGMFGEDFDIKFKEFLADWDAHGKAAGPIRNRRMAEYGDVLLLIWDGESRGSANMKKEMLKLKKPVYEIILKSTQFIEHDEL